MVTGARQAHAREADVQWARLAENRDQDVERGTRAERQGEASGRESGPQSGRRAERRAGPQSEAERAREAVGSVVDPELPYLTLEDLGVLGGIDVSAVGRVRVTVTPTFLGCPATAVIQRDIVTALHAHGWADAEVELAFQPPWTPDRITDRGRAKLAAEGYGIPARLGVGAMGPGAVGPGGATAGPVPVTIGSAPPMPCPQCGAADTAVLSRFGAAPCQEVRRCTACGEPFPALRPVHPTPTQTPAPATMVHPARTSGSRTA
jgi:ring-1,2-phenylacetyl-CoA epoxidase subunit PaaD